MRSAILGVFIIGFAIHAAAQMGPPSGNFNWMSTEVLAPAAGRGAGANGSLWRTDLWVRGAAGSTVVLEFHPMDASSDAPAATAEIVMHMATLYLPDILKNTFKLDEAFGNILLRSSSGVSATVRVYTVEGSGAYGAAFMAMPTSMAMRGNGGMMDDDDLYRMYVLGLLPQPRARVNLMVTNSGAAAVSGFVDILDADGLPASNTAPLPFSIRAYSSHQFNDILAGVASRTGDGSALHLRVRLTNGSSGMVMAIASVVDNTTNDTYTVMGNMMNGARGMMNP